ncbi:MAG: pyridoxal-phosphate dependent enzyme [Methylomonas sp.]|nr:pyridoxal-phosphate dependent enzyme [Methylomonas sp.]
MRALHPKLQALQAQLAPSPLQRLQDEVFSNHGVECWIKRDDLLHPVISGNKWRKLKAILDEALRIGTDTVVSMGGAHSNHLHALAYAGKCLGLKTMAYVRGERPGTLNPTLRDLLAWDMELRFVSRSVYRELRNYKAHDSLPDLRAGQYWLPEGGATELALKGVAEIVREIDIDYDVLAVACGTGTTLAGLIAVLPAKTYALGFAALKGGGFLNDDVERLLMGLPVERREWQILLDYHFGGFGKTPPALLDFIRQFQSRHAVALEPIYTGKMFYGLYDLVQKGHFRAGQRIVALHTGGLQGNRS